MDLVHKKTDGDKILPPKEYLELHKGAQEIRTKNINMKDMDEKVSEF